MNLGLEHWQSAVHHVCPGVKKRVLSCLVKIDKKLAASVVLCHKAWPFFASQGTELWHSHRRGRGDNHTVDAMPGHRQMQLEKCGKRKLNRSVTRLVILNILLYNLVLGLLKYKKSK